MTGRGKTPPQQKAHARRASGAQLQLETFHNLRAEGQRQERRSKIQTLVAGTTQEQALPLRAFELSGGPRWPAIIPLETDLGCA